MFFKVICFRKIRHLSLRKYFLCYLALVLFGIVYFFRPPVKIMDGGIRIYKSRYSSYYLPHHSKRRNDGKKKVLFWNFEEGETPNPYPDVGPPNASWTKCESTPDKNQIFTSHAVVIKADDIAVSELPPFRDPDQIFIYYSMEPMFIVERAVKRITSPIIENYFNWTITYKRDSDIMHNYGNVQKLEADEIAPQYPDVDMPSKSKLVAWVVSDCITDSKRELLAREIRKHIQVDIYGYCGNYQCKEQSGEECKEKISRVYKFYLAFENTLCDGYTTEKLYDTLMYPIVPIVYGGDNYTISAPSNSVIDTSQFKTAKELVEFLLYLDKNDTAYLEYFEWRKTHKIMRHGPWNELCDHLNDPSKTGVSFTYESVYNWHKDKCKRPEEFDLKFDVSESWLGMFLRKSDIFFFPFYYLML